VIFLGYLYNKIFITYPSPLAQNLATITASGDPITLSDMVKYDPSSNVLIMDSYGAAGRDA